MPGDPPLSGEVALCLSAEAACWVYLCLYERLREVEILFAGSLPCCLQCSPLPPQQLLQPEAGVRSQVSCLTPARPSDWSGYLTTSYLLGHTGSWCAGVCCETLGGYHGLSSSLLMLTSGQADFWDSKLCPSEFP